MTAWRYFESVFHLLIDLGFLGVALVALRVVLARGQRQHLAWVVPIVISSAVALAYRIQLDIHFWSGQRWGMAFYSVYIGWGIALRLVGCISIVGQFAFLELLRSQARVAAAEQAHASLTGDDVWPPPPTNGSGQ